MGSMPDNGTSRHCVGLVAGAGNDRRARAHWRFPHRTNEAEPFARQRFDQALFLAGIADRIPSGVQAGRQRSIRDDASLPNGADEVVFADDVLPVSNQVFEQVKNLRCDRYRIRPPVQFTALSVKRVILEEIAQVAIPSRGHLCITPGARRISCR